MSQEKQIDQVIGLEELFLSQEFGQTPGGGTAPAGPLVPLVPTASGAAGHASTTHRRRNAFAALSGTAAALLVALGLIGGSGRPTPVVHSASPSMPSGRGAPPPGFGEGAGVSAGTSAGSGRGRLSGTAPSPDTSVSLADLTTTTPAGRIVPAGSGAGTASTSPSPSPSGAPLAPVTSSVGGIAPGAGTAVSGLVTTITTGLPAATPLPLTAGPLAGG
jgi:hypothetical protein